MATFTGYSSASDGSIYAGNANYATCHAASTGTRDTGTIYVGNELFTITYYIYRGFLYFDTSSLAGATISAATLSVYASGVVSTLDDNLTVVSSTATDPLEATDFDLVGTTSFVDAPPLFSTMSTVAYTVMTLNASGITAINTAGGWTKFALRTTKDIAETVPNNRSYATLNASADAGASPEAKLIITYTPLTATTNYLKDYRERGGE